MVPSKVSQQYYRALTGLLRIFFKLLYHQFAWTYDWVAAAVSLRMWQNWVLAILPFINTSPVLELGYGPGHLQSALKRKGIKVYGLDASHQMGKLAVKRLRLNGYTPSLVNGIAQILPFANKSFQSVVATFPTEYIADPQTLAEIWRVLIPGGDLFILPVAWITGKRWIERIAAWIFRLTKQSPDFQLPNLGETSLADWSSPWLKPARQIGFQFEFEHLTVKSSILLVIHGVKNTCGN
jgi:ubiquinone/menaquinone biosynthesis C-methylase UbiE